MWWHLFVLSLSIEYCVSQIKPIKTPDDVVYQIIGLFEADAITQRLAFDESARGATQNGRRLEPIILQPNTSDSYSMWRELCKYKTFRPIAVFGPQNPISDGSVRDQCAITNIPHIQAAWQPFNPDYNFEEEETDEATEEPSKEEANVSDGNDDKSDKQPETPEFKKITINFYPDANEIAIAFAKLLKFYKWEGFTILYEDDLGLLRIQKILAEHTYKHPVTVRRLDPNGDNHKVFKELKEYQESRIFLDCHVDRIKGYMTMAQDLEMVNHYQHYILSSLDTSILAETLSKLTSNITWLSITEYDTLKGAQHFLAPRVGKWTLINIDPPPDVSGFQLEALIIDDLTKHLINAVVNLEKDMQQEGSDVYITNKYNYVCDDNDARWEYGARLQNEILKTNSTGVTGNIEFDEYGRRKNYVLYVNEVHLSNRDTIGRWMSANGAEIIDDRNETSKYGSAVAKNKNFIIISRKAKPYFYDKECGDDCGTSPNDKYEGFSVDLVDAIFQQLNKENFSYTYTFVHDKDKQYGKYDELTKKWDGLIGDLLDKKADLAVCDLTITEERKKVVDFSVPIMTLGISILYTQEHKVPPGMYSFLNPYTIDVWLYTATAYCAVSIVLFICSRIWDGNLPYSCAPKYYLPLQNTSDGEPREVLPGYGMATYHIPVLLSIIYRYKIRLMGNRERISPADWENPQPCDKDPEELENIWNFKNCTWLTVGSIMCQGCDILPKAFGTRWVCALWWFFAVIVCQTYIAQLSASMTSALDNEPINDVEDLAKQNKILYGAYKGGSTLEFFRSSKDKIYQAMYMNMMANDAVLTSSNDEGERRVIKGKNKYAFFMESSTIEYKLKRDCTLKKVGGELDSKDYGIAMPANSPFRTHINRAILTLKESTELDKIKTKWWEHKYNATKCEDKADESDVEGDLEMENLIGAFLVLIMGLGFSVLITAAEFMNEVRNIVVREQVTHKEAFVEELKASLNFFQLQKPVLRNPSRAPSVASSDKSDTEDKQDRKAAMIENFLDFEKQVQ